MPIHGPKAIWGVGFWAQTPNFLIIGGPFNQYDWKLVPGPAPIDQFWGYRASAVQQIWGPTDLGAKLFRGPLRGLPDQPPPPNAFQSWTASINLPWYYRPVVGEQFFDRPPLGPPPIDQTWTWSYNRNLVGQDKLPAGEQTYDLTPAQRPPEQIQLHSWSWSYNLNLIGQDRMAAGEQVYDRPQLLPVPSENLKSWAWSYNLNLIGKDRMVAGEQIYDRPTLPIPPTQSYTFQIQALLAPVVTGPLGVVANKYDWPVPTPYFRADQYFQNYNYPIYITPPDLGTKLFRGIWRSLPDQPAQPLHQQSPFPNLVIRTIFVQGPLGVLYNQYYWPITPAPAQAAQSWTQSYNLNLIGQDKLPTGEQTSDLPPRDFARLFQTWINAVNLALITAPPDIHTLARQLDWPLARGSEPDWRRSWEGWYNLNLVGQDRFPARQSDWPNPTQPFRQPDLATWIDRVKFLLFAPFKQTDWPLTPAPQQPAQSWTFSYNLNLIGQDALPKGEQFSELPPRDFLRQLQTWIQQTNLALLTAPPNIFAQARQTDWPLPGQPPRLDQTFTASFNKNLIGKDALPFRQSDWPLTPAAQRQVDLATWIDQVKRALTAMPFVQTDWPNPAGHTRPTLLQTWSTSRATFLPAPTFPPGRIFFDRPSLRPDVAADEYFWWSRYPVIPPPIPTVGASYRLLADHYLYGVYYKPNHIVTEGQEIPFGWVPTLAVDPLNQLAVNAYYAAGPRSNDYGDLSTFTNMYKREFADVPVNSPVTYWKQVQGSKMYQLQGLGIGLPPIGG